MSDEKSPSPEKSAPGKNAADDKTQTAPAKAEPALQPAPHLPKEAGGK